MLSIVPGVISQKKEDTSFASRIVNLLIAQHLQHTQKEYTLSVFLPECGVSVDSAPEDLIQVKKKSETKGIFTKCQLFDKKKLIE